MSTKVEQNAASIEFKIRDQMVIRMHSRHY